AGIFALMSPATGTFQTQPEAADLQQRLRVGADRIQHDVLNAGSGVEAAGKFLYFNQTATGFGGGYVGALEYYFPYLSPRRVGLVSPDGPNVVKSDVITTVSVPTTASVSMVWFGQGMVQKTDDLKYAMSPGCPFNLASCDWKVGERSIAYDGYG